MMNLNRPCKKKGNFVIDTAVFIIVVFTFAIFSIFAYLIFDNINTDFQADDDIQNLSKTELNDLYVAFPSTMDGALITAFVLLWIMVILSSFFINTHPVFFVLAIIFLAFIIFIAAVLANTHEELIAEPDITSFSEAFPMSNFLVSYLPYAVLAVAFSVLLVLFGKDRLL